MKKIVLFLLFLTLLVGCSKAENKSKTSKKKSEEITTRKSQTSTIKTTTEEKKQYYVIFNDYDGTFLCRVRVEEGEIPSYPLENPTRESDDDYNYYFSGWDHPLSETMENTVYYAKYSQIELSNISFDLAGGETTESLETFKTDVFSIDYFDFIVSREGYIFDGWSYNGEKIIDLNMNLVKKPNMNKNMVFKAVWVGTTDTHYSVEPYLQNINDDKYPTTPELVEDCVGTSGELTNVVANDYEGFTNENITQEIIDGNGTTVIRINYKRNYYNVILKKNLPKAGGTSLTGIIKYGGQVTIKATINAGYKFDGWYKDNDFITSSLSYSLTIPSEELTFEARYIPYKYKINIINNVEEVTISGITNDEEIDCGSSRTLTASGVPYDYSIKWSVSNGVVLEGNSVIFEVPAENVTITTTLLVYEKIGSSLYYGYYPQTLENDEYVIQVLNEKAQDLPTESNSGLWTSYGYYIFNKTSNFMWYIDIDLDEDGRYDYRGVYFIKYRPSQTNVDPTTEDLTRFQELNGYYINNIYWFKYERIKWKVISESSGVAFVIAELSIDSQPFCRVSVANSTKKYSHNGGTGYANDYALSDISRWLEYNFYNTAFNEYEKSIVKSLPSLLTLKDAQNNSALVFQLGFESTDYAKVQGVEGYEWYLQSPSTSISDPYIASYTYNVCSVLATNFFGHTSYVASTWKGIRPVMEIYL